MTHLSQDAGWRRPLLLRHDARDAADGLPDPDRDHVGAGRLRHEPHLGLGDRRQEGDGHKLRLHRR